MQEKLEKLQFCCRKISIELIFFCRYNRLMSGSIPKSLANCTQLAEFNIEGNSVSALPDGLLSSLGNLSYITLSRNQFSAFPAGGN